MTTQRIAFLTNYSPARTSAGPLSPVRRAFSALIRAFEAIATDYRAKRDVDQLKALSDETLRDIGIERSEIQSLVHDITYGRSGRRHAND